MEKADSLIRARIGPFLVGTQTDQVFHVRVSPQRFARGLCDLVFLRGMTARQHPRQRPLQVNRGKPVSILQDARRDVSAVIEAEIIDHYLKKTRQDPEAFRRHYAILGLQRNLRILGIFARLCLRDGKSHYVDMIPRVWGYVRRNLAHPALAQLAATVTTSLPEPNTDFLEQLKRRCPSQHTLS